MKRAVIIGAGELGEQAMVRAFNKGYSIFLVGSRKDLPQAELKVPIYNLHPISNSFEKEKISALSRLEPLNTFFY